MILSAELQQLQTNTAIDDSGETEDYIVIAQWADNARTIRDTAGAFGLPVKGDDAGTNGLVVLKVTVKQVNEAQNYAEQKRAFIYTVEWGEPPTKENDFEINPLSRPAEIDWGGIEITEFVREDSEGTPFANSAGDPYPPHERVINGGACTITRNESTNPASRVINFSNSTNASSWYGVAVGNAKFGMISGRKQFDAVYGVYWQTTYPILFNRKGWREKLLDNGVRKISSTDATRRTHIVDTHGVGVGDPVFLDGSGGELPAGGTPVYYPTDGFKWQDETDWASLSLPNPFL